MSGVAAEQSQVETDAVPAAGAVSTPLEAWVRRHAVLLALTSGVLLCWAHVDAPEWAWLAPIPLLAALRVADLRLAFYLGLLCGAVEATGLAGLMLAGGVLFLGVTLAYALARCAFALLCWWGWRTYVAWRQAQARGPVQKVGRGSPRALLDGLLAFGTWFWVPGVWVCIEAWHASIPYVLPNILGDTQWRGPLLNLASITGTYGLSFVLVAVANGLVHGLLGPRRFATRAAAAPALALAWSRWHALALTAAGAVCAMAAAHAVGEHQLQKQAPRQVTIAAVQGGLPTWFYSRSEAPVVTAADAAWARGPWTVYERLTQQSRSHKAASARGQPSTNQAQPPADLTIWPETAIWDAWGVGGSVQLALDQMRTTHGGRLLVGMPRDDGAGAIFNSAILLGPKTPGALQRQVQWTDKQRVALHAEGGMTPAAQPNMLHAPWPLGVVFCLESIVPQYALDLTQKGAQLLVVLAEGSRFGRTPIGAMHARHSVIRAVETGRTVVHAGQHGFTSTALPDGTVGPMLGPFHAGSLVTAVPLYQHQTIFVRYGAWWPLMLFAMLWLVAAGLFFARVWVAAPLHQR